MVQNNHEKSPKLASKYNLDNAENCEMKEHIIGSLPGCGKGAIITMQFKRRNNGLFMIEHGKCAIIFVQLRSKARLLLPPS